jgi:hypothetical protein
MSARRDEIDDELRHLRKLVTQLTDQQTLEGIKALIDLEAERAALSAPMETQPDRRRSEAARPMGHASSKRNTAHGKPPSVPSRNQAETARIRSLKKQRSMQPK